MIGTVGRWKFCNDQNTKKIKITAQLFLIFGIFSRYGYVRTVEILQCFKHSVGRFLTF